MIIHWNTNKATFIGTYAFSIPGVFQQVFSYNPQTAIDTDEFLRYFSRRDILRVNYRRNANIQR